MRPTAQQGTRVNASCETPVGPVRVDFSYGPNAPRFVGFRGTRDELLFGGGQRIEQKINAFQFHFSLGQTF